MTFGSTFGRVFSPTFQPKSQAAAAASGWWLAGGIAAANCVAAYQPKGAADYATSKVNLANAGTYDAVDGSAYPTWNSTNGWKFAKASSQYIHTPLQPTDSWTLMCRYSNYTGGDTLFGTGDSSRNDLIAVGVYGRLYFMWKTWETLDGGAMPASGIVAVHTEHAYKDGSIVGDIPTTLTTPIKSHLTIGGHEGNHGSVAYFISAYVQAFVAYNKILSDTEELAVSTAMAAL